MSTAGECPRTKSIRRAWISALPRKRDETEGERLGGIAPQCRGWVAEWDAPLTAPFHAPQKYHFEKTDRFDMNAWTLAFTGPGDIEVAECGFVDPKTTVIKPDFLMTVDLEDAITNSSPIRIAYDGKL